MRALISVVAFIQTGPRGGDEMLRPILILSCCSLLALLPTTIVRTSAFQAKVDEVDWPLFRGNALQTGVAKTTLPDKLEIRWKVDLKKGIESTAAIHKDTVYVGCYD